jgi:hypothetical protein
VPEKPGQERRKDIMNGSKPLSPERIAEIKAFKDVDISDCPELTGEELKKLRPRHPEYFKPKKRRYRFVLTLMSWPGLKDMEKGIKAGSIPYSGR